MSKSNVNKKVLLLQGGMGAERNVSLVTGKGFEQALIELGCEYQVIDCKEDLLEKITAAKKDFAPDVALLALHGKYAEDGIVQSICEYIKLPYTGAGVMGSALCMDKIFSKQVLIFNDIPTPAYQVVEKKQLSKFESVNFNLSSVAPKLNFPIVVKPSREGSSVGVSIVKTQNEFKAALYLAAQFDNYILIETFIDGMELTVPLLDGKVLTPIEIVPKSNFYDYANKYTAGNTEYFLPARIDQKNLESIKLLAVKAFEACRLRCYGRVDFRVDTKGNPFVIELNTLPGCTPTSLLPKAAKDSGISFNQLIAILIDSATLDYAGVK
ncbi:MAG: D-alanine--D-alanine ligase [Bdellovibrionales bacterium]